MNRLGILVTAKEIVSERLKKLFRQHQILFGDSASVSKQSCHTILYWGRTERYEAPTSLLKLNDPQRLPANRTVLSRQLQAHGLRVRFFQLQERSQLLQTQCYKALVFHLEVISLYCGFQQIAINRRSRRQRLLLREAVKAVYAAGMDFAEVELAVQANDGFELLNIDFAPQLSEEAEGEMVQALKRYDQAYQAAQRLIHRDIQLGADCELVLSTCDGKAVMASRYLSKQGRVGCDGVMLRGRGMIYPLVELRTLPSHDYKKQVQEIAVSLQLAINRIKRPDLGWFAGGMSLQGLPTGGHLHVSGAWLHAELLRVLDNYMALPYLLLEDDASLRRRPQYGGLGDFRRKNHGGFEYRCLPSWIVSPRLVLSVCALLRYLVEFWRTLRQRPLNDPALQLAFYNGEKTACRDAVEQIWQELQDKASFSPYYRHASYIFTQGLGGHTVDTLQDIRSPWKSFLQVADRKI